MDTHSLLAMFGVGPQELIVILIIVLVLFGGSRIPSLFRGLGQGVSEFKKGVQDAEAPKPPEEKKG